MNTASKKQRVDRAVQAQASRARRMSHEIHGFAERPFRETRSADTLAEYLSEAGFKVTFPYKKIATAFRAEWGTGKPVVGMLGEYDALPNCGAAEGSWGHG